MKWLQNFGIALVLLTATSQAAEVRLVRPKGASLTLVSRGGQEQISRFSGSMPIYGSLIANWSSEEDSIRLYSEVVLVPSKQAQGRLPYYVLLNSHKKLKYRVGQIQIANGLEALEMLTGQSSDDWKRARSGTLQVSGTFMVKDLTFWFECDSLQVTGVVTSVHIPTGQVASLTPPATC